MSAVDRADVLSLSSETPINSQVDFDMEVLLRCACLSVSMCVCMYVCMYVCVYVYMYVCMYGQSMHMWVSCQAVLPMPSVRWLCLMQCFNVCLPLRQVHQPPQPRHSLHRSAPGEQGSCVCVCRTSHVVRTYLCTYVHTPTPLIHMLHIAAPPR
jgi:hypothetical protein